VLCLSPVRADDERRDGNWWNMMSTSQKNNYVIGFFDGMDMGVFLGEPSIIVAGKASEAKVAELQVIQKRYDAAAKKYFENVTKGQVVDGLDEFYKDFKNRSITAIWGIHIVVHQIAGEDMDSYIIARRRYK
jgi:hypothetical protein